jgi:hypothetical protein
MPPSHLRRYAGNGRIFFPLHPPPSPASPRLFAERARRRDASRSLRPGEEREIAGGRAGEGGGGVLPLPREFSAAAFVRVRLAPEPKARGRGGGKEEGRGRRCLSERALRARLARHTFPSSSLLHRRSSSRISCDLSDLAGTHSVSGNRGPPPRAV